jgi:carbamoyltransferase
MLILGLNAFHADSAACLIKDGVIVGAVEEERFRRIKHWAGFPTEAIRWCLAEAGATLADVDHVALNQDSRAGFWRRALYVATQRPSPRLVLDRLRNRRERAGAGELLARAFPGEEFRGTIHAVEHHLAHLASAFLVSPFPEAVAASVDGFGDFASTAWGVGRGADLAIDGRVHFPHSLGLYYETITRYLGFPHYGDEYKVMGLAPYGEPSMLDRMRRIVRLEPGGGFSLDLAFFRHHREFTGYQWDGGSPVVTDQFTPALEELLGPRRRPDEPLDQRHKDIARSAQAMYEEAFFHLLQTLQARTGLTDLALAGGCANNSVANGKIHRQTPFRRLYVHPAPGDAGGAVGAALVVRQRLGIGPRLAMDHAYWGPAFGPRDFAQLLAARNADLVAAGCEIEQLDDPERLARRSAEAIAEGHVVGWFQGRLEWGPRALGNRSIVCDPRRADMKQILNAKIKRRESFRPFAPSVLDRAVAEWFEEDHPVPFMSQVFQIREAKRALIPAVTHADGSGRLQTVERSTNPLYYALIEAFAERTGVPMVLNTSFNENEPVVCRPEEALQCFLRTDMDALVLGNIHIRRRRV